MEPQDIFRLGILQNQSRQNQLLEEIRWRMMTPVEKAAALARREQEGKAQVYWVLGTLAFFGLLCGAIFLYAAYIDRRDNGPLTAEQVRSVIATRKSYRSYNSEDGPGGIRFQKSVLRSERRLTKDAIEMIASSDINFYPEYTLDEDEGKILSTKKRGWLVLVNSNNNIQALTTSAVNVWIVDVQIRSLESWQHHRGDLTLDLTHYSGGDSAEYFRKQVEAEVALLNQKGKRVNYGSFEW